MPTNTVVLKLDKQNSIQIGELLRFQGLVKGINLISLIDAVDLEANPRTSKTNNVTDAIIESIHRSTDIFPLKTKGILLGASKYEMLQRERIRIIFQDPTIEGILDGGHNMLAVGLYLLTAAGVPEAQTRKAKTWPAFKQLWRASRTEIGSLNANGKADPDFPLDFLMPVDLIVPLDLGDPVSVDMFASSITEICAARNNNVQLQLAAKANQSGYFDYLRQALPVEVANQVEWKTNDGGRINVRDIVALAWIPLTVYDKNEFRDSQGAVPDFPADTTIYRGKGDCMARFEKLMSLDSVTRADGAKNELINDKVKAALDIAGQMPALYDYICKNLPTAYNKWDGKFGRITAVKKMNPGDRLPNDLARSKYGQEKIPANIPEGFIVPFVVGLRSLMGLNEQGLVVWKAEPMAFLESHFEEIIRSLMSMFSEKGYDPQQVGKSAMSYTYTLDKFDLELLKSQRSA